MRMAGFSAGLAALISLALPAVVGALSTGSAGIVNIFRLGARGWLVGIGAGIQIGDLDVTLIPLGGVLLAILVTAWAVRFFVAEPNNEPMDQPITFIWVTAGVYGILAAITATASTSSGANIWYVRAAVAGVLVAGCGAALGLASRGALGGPMPVRLSGVLKSAALLAAAIIASAVVVVLSLFAVHIRRAGELWAALDPGNSGMMGAGGLGLGALCLVLAPNMVMWAVAVLFGPGFAFGTGTSVDLTGAHVGAVPGLPLMAALPAPGEFPIWVFLLGLIPAAAGVLAGYTIRRSLLTTALMDGASVGLAAGAFLAIVIAASAGSIGVERMADIGPDMLTPGLIAVVTLSATATIGAALRHYHGGHYRSERDTADSGSGIGFGDQFAGVIGRLFGPSVRGANRRGRG